MRVLFGENHDVCLLHDAALHSLQFVPRPRQRQEHQKIHHVANRRFRLPGAYRFDEYRIVPGCFAQDNALARSVPNPSCSPLAGRGPHEGVRVRGQARHARLVSKNAASGAFARRIVGQHRHATIFVHGQPDAKGFDERAFACAGRSGDSNADGRPRQGQAGVQQGLCAFAVVGVGAFHEGNAPRQQDAVPVPDAFEQFLYRGKRHAAPPSSIIPRRIRDAASVTGVPGPKISDTPAARRNA